MSDPTGGPQVTVKAAPVKVIISPDAPVTRTVRNSGAQAVTLSRDSNVKSGEGWKLAAAGEVRVTLSPGETLWALCAAAQETTLEVL